MRWLSVPLVLVAAAFVLAGPWLAVLEISAFNDDAHEVLVTGSVPPVSTEHRDALRVPLFVGTLVVGVLGSVLLVRVHLRRQVRSVARRPGLLLMGGLTLLDVAYFLDWSVVMEWHYLLRALFVVLAYPAAGLLVAGSAYALASVEESFAPSDPKPPVDASQRAW